MAAKSLVVVESPAKARTLSKYLGRKYRVLASMGHVKDLPKNRRGFEIDGGEYKAEYVRLEKKEEALGKILAAAATADAVFLATDPDREGEAIAWQIADEIAAPQKTKRVEFHEITRPAVLAAFERPRGIEMNLVNSQQARRLLDRFVGYDVSKLLWDRVRRGLSAGRVQSVALRLVVERERAIKAFRPVEWWDVLARLAQDSVEFEARLWRIKGRPLWAGRGDPPAQEKTTPDAPVHIRTEAEARKVADAARRSDWRVASVERKERARRPPPPFITSTLQQEAAKRLGYSVAETMRLAQRLYEGVDVGEGPIGLITYMRTDSPRISPLAVEETRAYIRREYGDRYLPAAPPEYKSRRGAQDAHEAIRPTSVERHPADIAPYVEKRMLEVYRLVWSRAVASQMAPAVYDQTTVEIEAGPANLPPPHPPSLVFRATGSVLKFDGYLKAWSDVHGADDEEVGGGALPPLREGDRPEVREVKPDRHETAPPPRYSEASLVKDLEEKGIGRPSTYAATIQTLQARQYVIADRKRLFATDLGMTVCDLLVEHFPDLFNVEFTAEMEEMLDRIEEEGHDWHEVLRRFHREFEKDLKIAHKGMDNLKAGIETEFTCPECGKPMKLRWGRHGRFLACSKFPKCRGSMDVREGDGGELVPIPPPKIDVACDACGRPMELRRSRFGEFLACSGYPDHCRATKHIHRRPDGTYEVEETPTVETPCPKCGGKMVVKRSRWGRFVACAKYPACDGKMALTTGVPCRRRKEGCAGEYVERRARGGRAFYSCSRYPDCDERLGGRPVQVECPACGEPVMFERETKADGPHLACPRKGCEGRRTIDAVPLQAAG